MALPHVDYLQIDSMLTESELMVRATARRFTEERVKPFIRDWWRAGRFPSELIPEFAALGFLGAPFEGYGCAGVSAVEYGLIMQELERGDTGVCDFAVAQNALVMHPIMQYGSEEQKARWIPRLRAGEAVGCFGLTEPDFGSNPSAMRTRADKTSTGWTITGEKTWITNGTLADVAIVWARTDAGIIQGFLVERGTPGFTSNDIHGKASMRASVTSSLVFHNCHVPADALLPAASGFNRTLACLSVGLLAIGWGVFGAALDCYETARAYTVARKQFEGRPIASHQLVQEKVAWMITEITKAQLLALHCAKLKDAGKLELGHVSMLKRNNAAMALECARMARDLLGANGITDDYPVMRHLCNLETVKTYEGTDHIHALIIGHRATGITAYK